MGKLRGVKFEKGSSGRIKKVTLNTKHHARFIENYLDHLEITEARIDPRFVKWEDVKSELDKKHRINSQELQH